jgi:hypothetical protein
MSAAAARIPSVIACLFMLAYMDVLVHVAGLRRALRLVTLTAGRRRVALAHEAVEATARRVAAVAAFYPRRALCLEQSLALYALLRRRGANAELRLGVQPRPFYAHAWVEIDGRPVAEQQDLPANLTVFPTLGV